MHYFLGVEIQQVDTRLFLSQRRYAQKILDKANMMDCKPQSTPLASRIAPPTNSENFHDPTLYRAIVGSLQYRTFTRPDLTFTVNYVSQFMSQPTDFHFSLVKCILRYPKHTLHYCHNILSISQRNLSDWDGCPLTR